MIFFKFCIVLLTLTAFASASAESILVNTTFPIPSKSYNDIVIVGTVESANDAQLVPLEDGVVVAVYVEDGDEVKQGQVLMKLDDRMPTLMLAQARATMDAAQVNYDEAQRLLKEIDDLSDQKLVAKTLRNSRFAQMQAATAELELAKANLNIRKETLKRHQLSAPFDGLIYNRTIDIGEWVTRNTMALSLVETNNLRVNIAIPQEYYSLVSDLEGQAVDVILSGKKATTVVGRVERIVRKSNPQSRVFSAHVNIPESNNIITGMSAEVQLPLPQTSSRALWLPVSALKQHPDGGASVFYVEDQRAIRQLVKVLATQGNQVLINNLDMNKPYITSSLNFIQDKTQVTIRDNGASK